MSDVTTPSVSVPVRSKAKFVLFVLVFLTLCGTGVFIWQKSSIAKADKTDRFTLLENQVDQLRNTVERHDEQLSKIEPALVANQKNVEALSTTATQLTEQIEAIKLAQTELATAKDSFLPAEALDALTQEVRSVQEKIALMSRRNAAPRMAPVVKKPVPAVVEPLVQNATPPFTVVGTESRGGETSVAITPANARSLDQIVLLREKDSLAHWQLKSIRGSQAIFQVDGRDQLVTLQ